MTRVAAVRVIAAIAASAASATPVAAQPAEQQPPPEVAAEPARPPRKPLPPYKPGPPDPAAIAAAEDANLEPETGRRDGTTLAVAFGPAILVGVNRAHATGTGGGFSFRIGRVADRDTVFTLEGSGVVFPYEVCDPERVCQRHINQSIVASVGAQRWVGRTLWLRGAVGVSSFTSRVEGRTFDDTQTRYGGAGLAGAGLEFARVRRFAFAAELMLQASIYRDSAVLGGGLSLSAMLL